MKQSTIKTLQLGNDWFGERQGGLNRVYSELIRHLPSTAVEVRGLVAGGPGVWSGSGGTVSGFAPVTAPLPWRLMQVRRAFAKVKEEFTPDLIASHFALYTAPVLDQLKRTPLVIHFHGPWAAEAGVEGQRTSLARVQAKFEKLTYSRGRLFIVLSQAFRSELVRRYAVPDHLVRIVPGGVDTARFNMFLTRKEARKRLQWPTDRPIVVAVRRQMKRMGLENLIDAFGEVRKRVPEALLLLGGTGPLAGELAERISAQNLTKNVRQLGRIEDQDLPLAYRAADLSVVPTQALEGFGMITLESLSSGTPVLVTAVGGLPEVIAPFAPQCIFPEPTSGAMAEMLIGFLSGKDRLPSDLACREYAETTFAWPVIAAQIRQVYEETLQ